MKDDQDYCFECSHLTMTEVWSGWSFQGPPEPMGTGLTCELFNVDLGLEDECTGRCEACRLAYPNVADVPRIVSQDPSEPGFDERIDPEDIPF